MQVQYGTYRDIEAWMNLVEELRGNFPGLETKESLTEHRETVLRFMKKEQALCVKAGEEIAGVLLFSKGHNMICCLGVSPAYRRRRIASSLLTAALGQLEKQEKSPYPPSGKTITRERLPERFIASLVLPRISSLRNSVIPARNSSCGHKPFLILLYLHTNPRCMQRVDTKD